MALRRLDREESHSFGEGAFDVRGWTVRTRADDAKAGTVDGMMVDDEGEFRYLDVDLGRMRKHVLLPLEFATADREDEVVWVAGLTSDQFEHMPEAAHEPSLLTEEYERRLRDEYRAASAGTLHDDRPEPGDEKEAVITRLSDMDDYRVRGALDPRGWTFVTGDGQKLGKVEELLVDRNSMRARYLVASIDEKALDLERIDRRVLIPVQHVELDEGHKRVFAGGLFARDLGGYPVYRGLPLKDDAMREIGTFWREHSATRDDSSAELGGESVSKAGAAADDRDGAARRPRRDPADRFFGRRRESHEAHSLHEGESLTVRGGHEVRISMRGDDIIVEREE